MIQVSGLKSQGRIVRETTAPFLIQDDEGERIENIAVRFYTFSIAEGRTYRESVDKLGDDVLFSDLLLPLLESLPDFVDDKKKPVKITREFLESLNTINLQAIHRSIGDMLSPKSPVDQIAKWLERGGGKATPIAAPPDNYTIMVIAERFGVLPDDVELRMSEYYFELVVSLMKAEVIVEKNREAAAKRRK